MVTIVSILFGLSCFFMGFVQNALMIGIGFLLIRMLGQGSLQLVSQTAINQWWVRKRGMIMGISGLLLALLGMGGFPSLVYWLISISDWRMTYIILGLSLLLIMAPVGYFFFRNRPEDYQLHPDGIAYAHDNSESQVPEDLPIEENWTLKEALHTRAFWVFGLSLSFFVLAITGITFHIVSIFQTQGLEPSLAASVFLPLAITAAITTLLVGYLSDHMPLNILFAVSMLLLALSMLMAQWLQGVGSVLLFGIIFGISNGAIRALSSVIWPSFYGRKHLGSIFGFTASMTVIGAAIGPLPFGFVYDTIGSYQPVLWVLAILSIAFGLAGLLTRKPSKG
jgi:MFS family permease